MGTKRGSKYTYEVCKELASKCESKSEFNKNTLASKISRENGWVNEWFTDKRIKYQTDEERKEAARERERIRSRKRRADERYIRKQKEYQLNHLLECRGYNRQYYNTANGLAQSRCDSYKRMDRKRGFDTSNNVTKNWIRDNILMGGECIYCGEKDFHKLGCDRIDNSRPHTPDNVVCSCGTCNVEREMTKKTIEEFKIYKRAVLIVEDMIKNGKDITLLIK